MKAGLLEERIKPADNEGGVCVRDTAEGVCTSRSYHKKPSLYADTADTPNDLRGTWIESQSSEETFSGENYLDMIFFLF